jgi:hypothetical protein
VRPPPTLRPRYPGEFLGLLPRDHLALFQRLAAAGDVTQIRLGRQHLILLNHPDDIKELLVGEQRSFVKGRALDRVKMLLGTGLLTNEGAAVTWGCCLESLARGGDAKWNALVDSVKADLADLPVLQGKELSARMKAHGERVQRLIAKHEGMMKGM